MILLMIVFVACWVIATAIFAVHFESEYDLDAADWCFAVLMGLCWPIFVAVAPVVIAAMILKDEMTKRAARREAGQS